MYLVTVANELFLERAKRLIKSYYSVYPDGYAYLFVFGNLSAFTVSIPGVRVIDVPITCSHAHDPRYFYFKIYAISWMANTLEYGAGFLYLDAANVIIERPIEIEESLENKGAFLLKFPPIEKLKLKYHTTIKCFELLDSNIECFKNEFTYWGAIQAYKASPANAAFLLANKLAIRDTTIIAPGNRILYPDGPDGECIHYCPEQSILSIMANKFKYNQPYSKDLFEKYGDKETVELLCPEEARNFNWKFKIKGRVPT